MHSLLPALRHSTLVLAAALAPSITPASDSVQLAAAWLERVAPSPAPAPAGQHALCSREGAVLATIVKLHPHGWVAIAASVRGSQQVLAYSLSSDTLGPAEAMLRSILEHHLGSVRAGSTGSSALAPPYHQWPAAGTTPTEGWLTSTWHQSAPFNDQCPLDPTTGARSLAGCPAVAMAQILDFVRTTRGTRLDDGDDYYHNYGGRRYWIDDDHAALDFPSFTQLDSQLDTLDAVWAADGQASTTDQAALVFACGVAAQQVYTSAGSGTFAVSQAFAAYQRFGFAESTLTTTDAAYLALTLNMIDRLPAHLALVTPDESAGHNVVVDGYTTNGFFHLNFGWGGSGNGWYLLPTGVPYDLTVLEGAITGIGRAPDGDDSPATATPVRPPLTERGTTLTPAGDVDWFRVNLAEGSTLVVHTDPVGGVTSDPAVWLYGPCRWDGSGLAESAPVAASLDATGSEQAHLEYLVADAGHYFIRLADDATWPPGSTAGAASAALLTIHVTVVPVAGDASGDGWIDAADLAELLEALADPGYLPAGTPDCSAGGLGNDDLECIAGSIFASVGGETR